MSMTCTQCGAGGLEQGLLLDSGQYALGYGHWVPGTVQLGIFGQAKNLWEKPKFRIDAHRCPRCGHLELFATERTE